MSRQNLTIGSFDTTIGWGILEVMRTARDLLSINLKRLRESAGWDQPRLAEETGISQQMIQKIEQRKTSPSQEYLDKLCAGLGCEMVDLYWPIKEPAAVAEPELPLDDARASEILLELDIVLKKYAKCPTERRLLALFVITLQEFYLSRYEALPNSDRQVSATLRRSLGTS